ncbi:MAG: M15 family metallopeptidase [Leptospiraceae bacterium]|nr:M15 family metallopeptidase [Leptospiraceae bacterium]
MNYILLFLGLGLFTIIFAEPRHELEEQWKKKGLVDVSTILPKVKVEIRYATKNNFMKKDVYDGMNKCYLQAIVADRLKQSYKYLTEIKPGYTLLIFDGARPLKVQKKMWKLVKGTSKQPYVADPSKGSIHNYGAAVDLTILNAEGKELDMGTEFDYFGELAEPVLEKKFLKEKKLTATQVNNRRLLRNVMRKGGFKVRSNEWWHFDSFTLEEAKKRFEIL